MFPIPATLRWSSSASPSGRVGSSPRSRRRNALESNSSRQHVGAERRQPLVEARPPLGDQLEQRPVELDHLVIAGAEHDPRPPRRAAASGDSGPYTPQMPVIPRCEWITRSPSKRRNRCLPWVSTLRTARPSRRAASGRARAADAASGSRPARDPRAPGGSGWPRTRSCRPRASVTQAERQPARPLLEAERDQRRRQRRVDRGLAVDLLEREALDPPARTCSTSAPAPARAAGRRRSTSVCSARPPRSRYSDRLAAGQDHVRARHARRPARVVAVGPATAARRRRAERGRRPRARPAGVLGRLGAQPLDGAGERELSAAESLDEVAAARDAERLELGQLGVDRREAARHALGEHLLAGQDPVALEHQLGQRAAPRRRGRPRAEQRCGQRPAALDLGRGARAAPARCEPAGARGAPDPLALRARERQARRAQRRERVVGRLARPGQIPQRLLELLGRELDVDEQVGEEAGAGGQPLADRVVRRRSDRRPRPSAAAGRARAGPRGSTAPAARVRPSAPAPIQTSSPLAHS